METVDSKHKEYMQAYTTYEYYNEELRGMKPTDESYHELICKKFKAYEQMVKLKSEL